MRKIFIFKRLISVLLLLGLPFLTNSVSASYPSRCKKDMPTGIKFINEGSGRWTITTTVREAVSESNSNNHIQSTVGLLKLEAFEDFIKYLSIYFSGGEAIFSAIFPINELPEIEGLSDKEIIELMKFGNGYDFSWNNIKRYLALPRIFESCYENGFIYVKGSWSSEEIIKINNAIALKDAFLELFGKFDENEIELLREKFPNLFEIEDPKLLIEIINNNQK